MARRGKDRGEEEEEEEEEVCRPPEVGSSHGVRRVVLRRNEEEEDRDMPYFGNLTLVSIIHSREWMPRERPRSAHFRQTHVVVYTTKERQNKDKENHDHE